MSSSKKVAVVTGANKGIGFYIVQKLCKSFEGDVILTSRDAERGKEAVKKLEGEGLKPKYHQLDITSDESVTKLKEFLQQEYGGLDALVNNAAIAYKHASTAPPSEQAPATVGVNFFGSLRVFRSLCPLLRPHSRVVYVSSRAGRIGIVGPPWREKFTSPSLTEEELCSLMQQFIDDAMEGRLEEKGWPLKFYGMSKVGTTALAIVHAKELSSCGKEDILCNACCPGLCRTDMSSGKGNRSAEEGAETPEHLVLLPPGGPTGEFWGEKRIILWDSTIN
jgi:carbonyl reductase 1